MERDLKYAHRTAILECQVTCKSEQNRHSFFFKYALDLFGKKELIVTLKSIDSCQPAQTAQADMNRNSLIQCIS